MKIGKNSPEKLLEEITKLEAVEFLGICKILGVKIYKDLEVGVLENVEENEESGRAKGEVNVKVDAREFYEIWNEVVDRIYEMNRTRRRNLAKLVYAAAKKEK